MEDHRDQFEREPLLPLSKPVLNEKGDDGYKDTQQSDNTHPLHELSERDNDDEKGNTAKQEEYKTYKRRWYILILFSVITGSQSTMWNTWGPIADTTKVVLGWDNSDIALLTNWGNITYVVSVPLFAWILALKGLRVSMLISSSLLMLGVAIRCIPVSTENLLWVMNIGQIFIGLANPYLTAAPPMVSAIWFPPHQRTTSTACLSTTAYIGVAASFLIGPKIVTDVKIENSTSVMSINETTYGNISGSLQELPILSPSVRNQHIHEINVLLYGEAGYIAILFILAVLYFPAKPPTPPSASAETKRQDFIEGAKVLFVSSHFWLPVLSYSFSVGVWTVWGSQLDVIFSTVNVGQGTIGWAGFYSNIVGVVFCIILARFVDRLGGKMKLVLMLIASVGVVFMIWIILMTLKVIEFNLASLYVSLIGVAIVINAGIPLYFELTVEGTYPVAEGITGMIMTWLYQLYGVIFLLIMMDPKIGVQWMNYVMLGAIAVCLPLLVPLKERYIRLTQDIAAETKANE